MTKAMASFRRVLAVCSFIPRCFDWKVQRFCWPKGTSLECVESIYVKTTGAACVSEELAMSIEEEEEEEEDGQIVSLGDRPFGYCVSMLKVRVVDLESS